MRRDQREQFVVGALDEGGVHLPHLFCFVGGGAWYRPEGVARRKVDALRRPFAECDSHLTVGTDVVGTQGVALAGLSSLTGRQIELLPYTVVSVDGNVEPRADQADIGRRARRG